MMIGGVDPANLEPCQPWCPVPEGDAPVGSQAWCCDALDLDNEMHLERAKWSARVASSILYRLSGSRFPGVCTSTEFLCVRRDSCGCVSFGCGSDRSFPRPSGNGSTWVNERCGCGASCDCASRRRVLLPYGPVVDIGKVTINGQELTEGDDFTLVDGRYLYLCTPVDIAACFDACDEEGFLVEWTHGVDPPPEARTAACVLACELAKACVGATCQLPKRVSNVSRQGVSWSILDPMDFLEKGMTGLYEVDLFLATWPRDTTPTSVVFPEDVSPLNFGDRARSTW